MSANPILQQQLDKIRDRLTAEPLGGETREAKDRVIAWQVERINQTYADLRADARTRPTVEFFLKEVYAARDFRQRDVELERVSRLLGRFLPDSALHYLAQMLEMNLLADELDTRMAHVLAANPEFRANSFDRSIWAELCRRCDDEAERRRLVQLTLEGGTRLNSLARSRKLGFAVKLARAPLELAGVGELFRIMHQGYDAFRGLPDCDAFLTTLVSRESQMLDEIWGRAG